MEPQIQYAKTSDGVNIAFASMGEGPPLVFLGSPGVAHVQKAWVMFPDVLEPLARTFRVILYDPRGTSLSDREATDFSMEAMIRDLEAVIERTSLQSFAIVAFSDGVPIAVTYAATFPDRVSHLILIDGWTAPSDYIHTPEWEAADALLDKDWTLYTETLARVLLGIDDQRLSESLGEYMRTCVEPEAYRAFVAASKSYDVSALLTDVRAETLVLHNSDSFYPVRGGQKLAAGIPNAGFLAIDDMNYGRVAPLIQEFAGATEMPEPAEPGAFRTILFTDVEGSTALTERLGDAKARELLREHESVVREALKAHGGSEVKTMGDGIMTSFSSATKALECAIAIQKAFDERNRSLPAHPEALEGQAESIKVRIGLNAGEPIEENDSGGRSDLFGTAVNMAARIASKADGGEILVSDVVRQLVAGKEFLFNDRGETELRGFEDPIRVYEARWQP
jgi:class 3 adenylate cyclase